MDDLTSEGPVIDQTLRELEIINRLLGGNHVTISGLDKLAASKDALTIIDLGCGGGDMLIRIAKWAQAKNIEARIIGIDANPNIVEYARKNTADYPNIEYKAMDIFSSEFNALDCDVFTATLFMHHLTDEEFVATLKKMKHQARLGIVINDIHRHWFAYYSIKTLTRLFSKSEMVRNDAAVSVKRAFSKGELANMLFAATIPDFDIDWKWAFRWQLVARTT